MVPLAGHAGESWDVVVIDEIQMMGDSYRGGAWTNAVMGVNAKEIHLCGDETTAALLQTMIDGFHGDTLTVHRYDRLTPLSVADKSLEGDWNNIQPGDCVVTFSRSNVFSVKKSVESTLGKRCSVVYGALPPETRAEQARQFNESNGRAEVMVASDAVGMGLNL
jgi:ATP-dependent RNA helicase SUPV3L1/SUV3